MYACMYSIVQYSLVCIHVCEHRHILFHVRSFSDVEYVVVYPYTKALYARVLHRRHAKLFCVGEAERTRSWRAVIESIMQLAGDGCLWVRLGQYASFVGCSVRSIPST